MVLSGQETYRTLPGGNTNEGIGGNRSSVEAEHQEEAEIKLQMETED